MEFLNNSVEVSILNMLTENNNEYIKYLQNKKFKNKKQKLLLLQIFGSRQITHLKIPKVSNYIDIIDSFPEEVFHSHLRMSHGAFMEFLDLLQSSEKSLPTGRPTTPLKERLLITLWALANQNSFRELGDRFNKSKGTSYYIVIKTCQSICKLIHKFVIWPSTNEEINFNVEQFNYLRGSDSFPNVVGCVDGMHIAIPTPSKDPSSYYNRKGFHSLVLQAVCNAKGAFINVFFGWPGRSHDAWVFKRSMLGKNLENGTIKIPPDVHILGDSAYPLKTYLMVPYRDNGNLSESQKAFNYRLSSTRVLIEQSFGILKSKFRMLNRVQFKKTSEIKYIVIACIILHNFIISYGDEPINLQSLTTENQSDLPEPNEDIQETSAAASEKRNNICNLLFA